VNRSGLIQSLMRQLACGEYVVDPHAVAEAILDRVDGPAPLPFASGMLVAAKCSRLPTRAE
jgi:hypothetical protein